MTDQPNPVAALEAELAELRLTSRALLGWKWAAVAVLARWDEVAATVPQRLGALKPTLVREELERLRARVAELEAALRRVAPCDETPSATGPVARWTNGTLRDLEVPESRFLAEDLGEYGVRLVAEAEPCGYMGGTEEVCRVLDRADVARLRDWFDAWLKPQPPAEAPGETP